jgi:protein involved in polysaccharide export with SLBB domain
MLRRIINWASAPSIPLCALFGVAVLGNGCALHTADRHAMAIGNSAVPRELCKATLPVYRIEPPDILLIRATDLRDENRVIEEGDTFFLSMTGGDTLAGKVAAELTPLEQAESAAEVRFKVPTGEYTVGPDGAMDLGPVYGKIPVRGLSIEDGQQAIHDQLQKVGGLKNPQVWLEFTRVGEKQIIGGEHLVRPDGTVGLGVYGSLYVAGLSVDEVQAMVADHLRRFDGRKRFQNPQVSVDVFAYNSKVIYVIMDGGGYGEQIIRLPFTGNETVLDAISQVNGLSQVSSKHVWVARPSPSDCTQTQILDVHWSAITAEGVTTTNYQLMPGDRIYVRADKLIATDNFLGKLLAPVERVLGVALLGRYTVQGQNFGN